MADSSVVALVVVLLAVGVLVAVLMPDRIERELKGQWPLARKRLMDEAQLDALLRLQLKLPSMHVMAGVSMSRLIYVIPVGKAADMTARSAYWARKKHSMSVDFAVCDAQGVVAAVVEMRGAKDLKGWKAMAQQEKQKMLESAGILFFSVAGSNPDEIARKILEKAHDGRSVGGRGSSRGSGHRVDLDRAEEAA
jgi:hypothetical protein